MGGFVNSYAVELKPSARKELESLPNTALARILRKVESVALDPRPAGCKKLKGYKDLWRVRIGEWRIVDDAARLVSVTRVAHRSKVYDYASNVRSRTAALRLDRFLLNHYFQVRGHVLMQLHGDGELAHGLQRLVKLNLAAIDVETLLGQRVADVARRD
jgi:mRNA interferase RelE/StbE